jgi:hypothetical protein
MLIKSIQTFAQMCITAIMMVMFGIMLTGYIGYNYAMIRIGIAVIKGLYNAI